MRDMLRKAMKLSALLRNPAYRRGLRFGVAAAVEHAGAIRAADVGTLVDVGANKGQFSLVARAIQPDCHIVSFEPLPDEAAVYSRILPQSEKTRLLPVAASDKAGSAVIHVSGRPDSSSLLPITDLQNRLFPGTAEVQTLNVKTVRLDDVLDAADLPAPIFIKADVQGHELAILKGAEVLLSKADYVYLEVSFYELYEGQSLAHELIEWLSQRKFRLGGVYNLVTDEEGRSIQADMLFSRA